jgi:hypothetical protein
MKPGGFPERIVRGRWLRAAFLGVVLLLLATISNIPPPQPQPAPGEAALIYSPVRLEADAPDRRAVGRLEFIAGWQLSSPDPRFGGISGLHVEGAEAIALGDAGMILRFPMPGASPAPRVRFQPVEQGPGRARNRLTRDTEGLQVVGDRLWLSFERYNAVWRYDRTTLRGQAGAQPAAMRRWRGNSGAEAMVRLADGRFLLFQEGPDDGLPLSEAVLFAGDPALAATPGARVIYRRPPGYRATDAALLPDGRILILNRSLSGLRLSAKLVLADVRRLALGQMIQGEEIATFEAPLLVDNMEAVSVTSENGRTIVWLASDDDFMRLFRRTLLLKFALRL